MQEDEELEEGEISVVGLKGSNDDFQHIVEAALSVSNNHSTTKEKKGKGKMEDSVGRGFSPIVADQLMKILV